MNTVNGKYIIQRYWFDEATISDVMEHYGIKNDDNCRESVAKVLVKSKKDFRNGWSYFTREDIDSKIRSIVSRCV